MSPEEPEVEASYREVNGSVTNNLGKMASNDEIVVNAELDKAQQTRKQRERRTQPLENFTEPLSPASSSSASQANTATDITFEPTIDMMVNDFDDEQTLNEEEALAATEQQDPQDEIATLKEESEMPLEMLLAKYAVHSQTSPLPEPPPPPARKRPKKTNKKLKSKRNESIITDNEAKTNNGDVTSSTSENTTQPLEMHENADVIVIESGDEDQTEIEAKIAPEEDVDVNGPEITVTSEVNGNVATDDCNAKRLGKVKQRRSHLLDLYPEQTFGPTDEGKVIALEMLYGDEEEEDDDDEEAEDDEIDNDYVTKTIMVGTAYQAVIPDGLSQYGDVLPYENEDKLIWEPSQVSEQEVEQYLIKARDIKPTLTDDEPMEMPTAMKTTNKEQTSSAHEQQTKVDIDNNAGNMDDINSQNAGAESKNSGDADLSGVIKDNEQALHLLVQCGYDFKEALRRKRLNALPLTGSMSIWSEEECHKFEEGFQKFGKDFLKIRQNQVRTRSMRELVQFYYLWKKSERRDHEFANSDTVDHMDMFLNEGGDYGSNASAANNCASGIGIPPIASSSLNARKSTANTQKNFSIMTGNNVCSNASSTSLQNNTTTTKFNNRRRATAVSNIVAATAGLSANASLITVNASDNPTNAPTATSCATK